MLIFFFTKLLFFWYSVIRIEVVMSFNEELIKQNEELKNGVLQEQQINTESFFFLVKGSAEKISISFVPLNRQNYQEMFMMNIDLDYLKELCHNDGINFYIDYVENGPIKWQTFFFEVSLAKKLSLTK